MPHPTLPKEDGMEFILFQNTRLNLQLGETYKKSQKEQHRYHGEGMIHG